MPELLLGILFLGPGAAVLAAVLAYVFASSPARMPAIAALGVPLVLGLFLWAWLESSPTESCWDCGQVLGRWMSPVFVFYLIVNAVAWVGGAVTGWAIRQTRRRPGLTAPTSGP